MPFDPREFITVARSCNELDQTEGTYRTGIGRAYYGVFLEAREQFERRGVRIRGISPNQAPLEHGKVRATLKQYHRWAGERLVTLYELRVKSDYHVGATVSLADLRQALDCVDYLINVFDNVIFPPGKPGEPR